MKKRVEYIRELLLFLVPIYILLAFPVYDFHNIQEIIRGNGSNFHVVFAPTMLAIAFSYLLYVLFISSQKSHLVTTWIMIAETVILLIIDMGISSLRIIVYYNYSLFFWLAFSLLAVLVAAQILRIREART